MKRIVFMFVIILVCSSGYDAYSMNPCRLHPGVASMADQDTIQKRQILYNGILWENKYHRIKGDQFLFTDFFIPSKVTINGKEFENVRIKYDIYSDEIITPVNSEDILQLNKEMVDSFTINIENKIYKFTNVMADSLKSFKGYVNELYKGNSALYLKYKKIIIPAVTSQSDGTFNLISQMYFRKGNNIYPIKNINDLLKILNTQKVQIKSYIKKNKLKVSKKIPESFIQVIRYYDSISQ